MQIPIKRTIERIPGGMMIVPLALGCAAAYFLPQLRTEPKRFSFTGELFTGALPILAVFYVCMGATISIGAAPRIITKGGALLATKVLCGIVAALVLGKLIGTKPIQTGALMGLSTLAVVAAFNDTNGGLYMALMGQYGRAEDVAACSIMSLESGPFLTMVSLGIAGSTFPWQTLVGAILPLVIGMILGNLDRDLREFFGRAVHVLIPFFAFALGTGIKVTDLWRAGLLGIGLGVAVVLITGTLLFLADRITGGTGVAGLAAASTAGNAAAVPLAIASANSEYAPAAENAAALVGASVVVTAILVPIVTVWWAGRVARRTYRVEFVEREGVLSK